MQFHTYMDIIEFRHRFVSFEILNTKGTLQLKKMRANAILSISIKVHIKINLWRTEKKQYERNWFSFMDYFLEYRIIYNKHLSLTLQKQEPCARHMTF